MITIKTKEEIAKMKKGGKILAGILETLKRKIKPGVSTARIELLARDLIKKNNAQPAFLGYRNRRNHKNQKPFPTALCLSFNEELVHTPTFPSRLVKKGDLISLDLGICYQGFFTDAAITFGVGQISRRAKKIIKVTEKSFFVGLKKIKAGAYLGDLSSAIQNFVEKNKFSVIRQLTGHGIGKKLHEEPMIPNFGQPQTGPKLGKGMTLAVEPMVSAGHYEVETLSDGWTVVMKDRSLSAHFEHTVVVTQQGAQILTQL